MQFAMAKSRALSLAQNKTHFGPASADDAARRPFAMFHDPLVTRTAVPEHLVPKPGSSGSVPPVAAAVAAPAAAKAASTTTRPAPPPTLGQEVLSLCQAALATAFPGVECPVIVVTSFKAAHFQNNTAMQLFKVLKDAGRAGEAGSPKDVAAAIAAATVSCDTAGLLDKCEAAGPGFVNLHVSRLYLERTVNSILHHGPMPPPYAPKRVVVDFSSPNVAKEMHVGHLRSTIIGDSLCRILVFCGHTVARVNHVGDWGTQFGMLIAHLKNVFPDYATQPPPIADLQTFYREAKAAFDADDEFKKVAHAEVVRLQGGDGASRFAWKAICEVSRLEFEKVYSRLGVELDEVGESFYNEYIPPVIAHLTEIGVATVSNGAKVIFPPGTKHEQPLIVQKGDGGFGYDSTDMAAIWYRCLELQADWLIYVTDAGQSQHFELVFAAARWAGFVGDKRLDHCPFGLVCGSDGKKFKTRSGDVTRLVDLLDEAVARMQATMKERWDADVASGKLPPYEVSRLEATARVMGYGAVKYADLKSNRINNYVFSYDRMLDDKGNTAVYLLYAGARLSSIQRNAAAKGFDSEAFVAAGATVSLEQPAELELGLALARFGDVIDLATQTLEPSKLCEYIYDLCGKFTSFYQACKVIDSGVVNPSRLLLVRATQRVIQQTNELLGIGYVDKV